MMVMMALMMAVLLVVCDRIHKLKRLSQRLQDHLVSCGYCFKLEKLK